jgi:hypothetical protein
MGDLDKANDKLKDFGNAFGQDLIGNIEAVRDSFGELVADIYEFDLRQLQKKISKEFSKGFIQASFAESFAATSINAVKNEAGQRGAIRSIGSTLGVIESGPVAQRRAQEVLLIQEQIRSLTDSNISSQEELTKAFNAAYETLKSGNVVSEEGLRKLMALGKEWGVYSDKVEQGGQAAREALQEQEDEARRVAEILEQVQNGYLNATGQAQTSRNATAQYVNEMAKVFEGARNLREELGGAAYEALVLSGIDISSGVDAAAKAAAVLAARLKISVQEALNMIALSDPLDPFGGPGRFIPKRSPSWEDQVDPDKPGGGGGGSARDPLAELRKQLDLERELVGVSEDRARVINALGN